jgi:hypothetical protein
VTLLANYCLAAQLLTRGKWCSLSWLSEQMKSCTELLTLLVRSSQAGEVTEATIGLMLGRLD